MSYLFFSLLVVGLSPADGDEVDDVNDAVGMISAFNLELSRVDPEREVKVDLWLAIFLKSTFVEKLGNVVSNYAGLQN